MPHFVAEKTFRILNSAGSISEYTVDCKDNFFLRKNIVFVLKKKILPVFNNLVVPSFVIYQKIKKTFQDFLIIIFQRRTELISSDLQIIIFMRQDNIVGILEWFRRNRQFSDNDEDEVYVE